MTGAPKYTMGVAIPDRKYADYPGPLTYRPESVSEVYTCIDNKLNNIIDSG
ncbi:unnamed protein product [Trichobilharzia regenti]|nr:unnamed protein product [Trichobilharzia regenti]